MLTREEAIRTLSEGNCKHDSVIKCVQCYRDIIELLKQQPEQPRREIVEIIMANGYMLDENLVKPSIFVKTSDNLIFNMVIWPENKSEWKKLPPIPQDDDKENHNAD